MTRRVWLKPLQVFRDCLIELKVFLQLAIGDDAGAHLDDTVH